MFAKLQKSDC